MIFKLCICLYVQGFVLSTDASRDRVLYHFECWSTSSWQGMQYMRNVINARPCKTIFSGQIYHCCVDLFVCECSDASAQALTPPYFKACLPLRENSRTNPLICASSLFKLFGPACIFPGAGIVINHGLHDFKIR